MKELLVLSALLITSSPTMAGDGGRLLGMGVNAGGVGFEKAIHAAREAGLQVIELPQQWDDVEPRPGVYKSDWLDIANAYYPTTGVKLVVSLNPIDTNALRVPTDLRGKPFDDPEVIQRYNRAADFVLGRIKNVKLVGFAIGNEIDGTLQSHQRQWEQYATFFRATSEHVRRRRPGVPVGTKITQTGLVGAGAARSATVNASADVVMATYYPLDTRFHVKDLATARRDIDKLATLPGKKPIYLLEVGCPSSERINSSPARQAQFVQEVFRAWDAHRNRLKLVNFIWLNDISPREVQSYTKYYDVSSHGFADFLSSLGLRTYDGRDKGAFRVLRDEARKRGW